MFGVVIGFGCNGPGKITTVAMFIILSLPIKLIQLRQFCISF
jgi:hypothetical protein